MVKEAIIGFDCREMWLSNIEHVPAAERNYLLRPDIKRLLTIDRTQWQSVFASHYSRINGDWVGFVPGYHLEIPEQYRTSGWFWEDLSAMQNFLEVHKNEYQNQSWLIAITVARTSHYETLEFPSLLRETLIPMPLIAYPDIDPAWRFLGYDVEDGCPTFWEGLEGGAYPDEDLLPMRERWGASLNEYHLFTEQEKANQFADWLNGRESHRIPPFFVFGLYLIDSFLKHS